MKKNLEKCKGKPVVIDTNSSWLYIGILKEVSHNTAVLEEVDAHDTRDSETSKELYVYDTRTTGIKPNRMRVYINLDRVVSFSLLEDVKAF